MIISHSKKFCFFRVAKTGSTTANFMLRMADVLDMDVDQMTGEDWLGLSDVNKNWPDNEINWSHATPQQLVEHNILTMEQLREYDCYAYLRPMKDRFVSACLHSIRNKYWGKYDSMGLRPHQFITRWRDMENARVNGIAIVGKPQVAWFFVNGEQVVEPLDFKNYDDELHKMIARLGGRTFNELPRLNVNGMTNENRRQWLESAWGTYPEIQIEVSRLYADDVAFYNRHFGDKGE